MTTKFCIDCKHSLKSEYNEDIYRCLASNDFSLVTGERKIAFCSVEREWVGRCTPEAIFFELKT